MAEENADVFELVNTTALDALEDGAAAVAIHGLKNELNRLHELHKMAAALEADSEYQFIGLDAEEVWTRIIVIQEALLDVARMLVKKG